jgi:hypothetical protein
MATGTSPGRGGLPPPMSLGDRNRVVRSSGLGIGVTTTRRRREGPSIPGAMPLDIRVYRAEDLVVLRTRC